MELLTIKQVAAELHVSESTIRRRLRERREGKSSFPLPIFSPKRKALWKIEEIIDWKEDEPSGPTIETSSQRNRRLTIARNQLQAQHKVKVKNGKEGAIK